MARPPYAQQHSSRSASTAANPPSERRASGGVLNATNATELMSTASSAVGSRHGISKTLTASAGFSCDRSSRARATRAAADSRTRYSARMSTQYLREARRVSWRFSVVAGGA